MKTENETDNVQLLTPKQLSDFLQIPARTLEEWRQHRSGPPYLRLGRHVRYDVDSVAAWFKTLEVNA